MIEPRKPLDWEAIERDYRAGILSLREIGRLHEVSDTAIRKRAKEHAWERDLAEKVRALTKAKLVRTLGSQGGSQDQRANDSQIIEDAALVLVALVRDHRRDISQGREAIRNLVSELIEAGDNRGEIEEAIEDETKREPNGKRRAMMLRAVSLSSRATTAASLSVAMKNIVGLERQAFNLPDRAEPAERDETPIAISLSDDQLDAIARGSRH